MVVTVVEVRRFTFAAHQMRIVSTPLNTLLIRVQYKVKFPLGVRFTFISAYALFL
jgi:hypothetical protein